MTSRTAPEQSRDEQRPDPRRWRILGVSLVVGFMTLLDVSIVNVAVPSMQQGLHTSIGTVQWVVSGYALAFGLTLVAGGRLGDAYGRRRLMLIGLVGFIVSSAAVGVAPTALLVVGARLLQGLAAGLLTPQNSGLIQQLFGGRERGRAFGLFGFTVSVSSAAGPVLGGLILAAAGSQEGWRYLFLINVPIGLVLLPFVATMVPGRAEAATDPRIDVPGALLLGGVVLSVLYPVVSVEGRSYWSLPLLAMAPVLGWAFVRWERRTVRRGGTPLLDIALLRRAPGYAGGLAIGTLYFTGFTGLILVTSFYLQQGLGMSPLRAGLLIAPYAVGAAISSPIAGNFVSDVGRKITVAAVAVVIIGAAALAVLAPMQTADRLWLVSVPALFVAGLGGGAVVSPNLTLSLAEVPPAMGGAAGGALQTGQRIGSSIGSALLMTAYSLSAAHVAPHDALQVALATAVVLFAVALAMAVHDWRRG